VGEVSQVEVASLCWTALHFGPARCCSQATLKRQCRMVSSLQHEAPSLGAKGLWCGSRCCCRLVSEDRVLVCSWFLRLDWSHCSSCNFGTRSTADEGKSWFMWVAVRLVLVASVSWCVGCNVGVGCTCFCWLDPHC